MKKIEAPYLLFALIFGFMALIAPYLMEEHRLTLEGRLSMFLFQAGMELVCALATAKHLHDKWVQEEIDDRQARLRMPRHEGDEHTPESAASDAPAMAQEATSESGVETQISASADTASASGPQGSERASTGKTPPV